MDKKNTMLLTVIAVATLLVAVVGATFAFFTASQTNNSGTSTITATTESLSTVFFKGEDSTLTLNTTTANFVDTGVAQDLWASSTGTPAGSAQYAEVGKVEIDGEGTYACDVTVKVTASGLPEGIKAADGLVQVDINGTVQTVDLATLKAGEKTFTATWDNLTSSSDNYVKAAAKLVNTTADQPYLQGQTGITFTTVVSGFECDLTSDAD